MGYPSTYYVMPEHHIRLSDDKSEIVFDQHLPGVRKDDLNVEVLEGSICMEFQPEGKDVVSRCYSLPYAVDPSTAAGEFRDGVLHLRVKLRESLVPGKRISFE
jgi:HSP20 family molecular chaperone IbpA